MHASTSDRALSSPSTSTDTPDEARSTPDPSQFGPAIGPTNDAVEAALARALDAAATAGRFDVVSQLARELEARRLARTPNVVTLPASRRR